MVSCISQYSACHEEEAESVRYRGPTSTNIIQYYCSTPAHVRYGAAKRTRAMFSVHACLYVLADEYAV